LFRDGYFIPLLEPLKSIKGGIHLGGDLKLVNEYCRRHIGGTTSIDDEFANLATNSVLGVEYLLPLTRFKRNLSSMKGSLNHYNSPTSGRPSCGHPLYTLLHSPSPL